MLNSPDNRGDKPKQAPPEFATKRPDNLYTRSKKTYEVLSKLVVSKVAPPKPQAQNYLRASDVAQSAQPSAEEPNRLVGTLIIAALGIVGIFIIVAVYSNYQKAAQADADVAHALESIQKGDNKAAVEQLNAAEQLGYRQSKLYLMRAAAEATTDDHQKAIQDFTAGLNANPTDPVALVGRAASLLKTEQYASAIADCDAALKARPDFGEALRVKAAAEVSSNKFDAALKDCDSYLAMVKTSPDPEVINTRAFARLKLGQTAEALKDLDQVIAVMPDKPDFLVMRAQCNLKLTNIDKAIDDLTAALKIDPANMSALALRANCYVQQKKTAEALADLNLVIEHSPTAMTYAARAGINADLKKYAEAVDDYDHALALSPSDTAIHAKREDAFTQFKKTQPAGSVTADAEDHTPSLPALRQGADKLTAKGYAAFKQGNYDSAIESLSYAVRANPGDPGPRHYLAYAYMSQGNSMGAVEQFQALMGMGKLNDTDQMQFARALTAVGRNDEAVDILKDVVASNPSNSWARISLIKLYIDAGVTVKAAKLAQEGLSTATSQSDRDAYQKLLRQTMGGSSGGESSRN